MTEVTSAEPTVIDIDVSLAYDIGSPATLMFSVGAARTERQRIRSEELVLDPDLSYETPEYGDAGQQLVRVSAQPGPLSLRYRAQVAVDGPPAERDDIPEVRFDSLPSETLPYVNPSRYCESDRLLGLANRLFGDLPPGYARVESVSQWVGDNMTYLAGVTDASTSATDALVGRAGVCRDYAHVAITMCRAIGVPARYVSGYGLGVDPPDFHGFLEAFVGDDWFLFDPTGMSSPGALVRIAVGRDAADVAFATFVGQATLTDKQVSVTRSD